MAGPSPLKPGRIDFPPCCCLCGYTAAPEPACGAVGEHRLCYRCYSAYRLGALSWSPADQGDEAADGKTVERGGALRCPAQECSGTLAAEGRLRPQRVQPGASALTPLTENSDEMGRVLARFYETIDRGSNPICGVYRVENPTLFDMHTLCQQRFLREQRPTGARLMFHGTDRASVGSIVRSGFDYRYVGSRSGQAWGRGIYFAADARYSDDFAVEDVAARRCVIVARVLPGQSVKAGAGQTAGPGAQEPNAYDSVSALHGRIVVIFREQQACPLYAIYYKKRR